ncbi:MAG: hypothetical protein LBV15_05210 [Planctomycetota bacterium]|jgi:hypothetical protein|nr:hypothetical protein [Planctomycetota bacterium]
MRKGLFDIQTRFAKIDRNGDLLAKINQYWRHRARGALSPDHASPPPE